MLELKEFDKSDYYRYPYVEDFCGEITPMLARVKMAPPTYEGWVAIVVVDGNGIQVRVYNENGKPRMVFCRELYPFPLAVLVAEHLGEPLDLDVLTRFGFEKFR